MVIVPRSFFFCMRIFLWWQNHPDGWSGRLIGRQRIRQRKLRERRVTFSKDDTKKIGTVTA
jgi:hypothetical protein